MSVLAAFVLAASGAARSLCGLEEIRDPQLAVCPPWVTYDEDGEEIGQAASNSGNSQDEGMQYN
ncbi:MAG TPA: hypothetical protein VE567_01795 [Sphingomonas sp.]|nr:hypothetical protein [Sphingomonas sp.]